MAQYGDRSVRRNSETRGQGGGGVGCQALLWRRCRENWDERVVALALVQGTSTHSYRRNNSCRRVGE